jgi:catechol 2,3-dioxygenase-like lactoylglutathione lyase family enzyme
VSEDENNGREWPSRVEAITLFVDDLSATADFYQQVFGLPIMFSDDDSAVFDFGNLLVNLLKDTQAEELIGPAPVAAVDAGSRFQFTVPVRDVDTSCVELGRRGVTLINGPMDRPWGIRTAAFRDPGGHVWEIAVPVAATESPQV